MSKQEAQELTGKDKGARGHSYTGPAQKPDEREQVSAARCLKMRNKAAGLGSSLAVSLGWEEKKLWREITCLDVSLIRDPS